MNNEVNFVSSGINSAVSICKATLSAHYESVTILRGSLKFLSTMKIAHNSAFGQTSKGFVPPYLDLLIYNLAFLIYLHQYRIMGYSY